MAHLGLARAYFNAEAIGDAFFHLNKAAELATQGKLTPKKAKWISLGRQQIEAILAAPEGRAAEENP